MAVSCRGPETLKSYNRVYLNLISTLIAIPTTIGRIVRSHDMGLSFWFDIMRLTATIK